MFWLTAEMFKKQTTILFFVSYDGHLKILMFAAVGWTKHLTTSHQSLWNCSGHFSSLINWLVNILIDVCRFTNIKMFIVTVVHTRIGLSIDWLLNSICRLDVFVISASCYSWRCSRITKWKLTPDVSSDGSWFHFSLRQFLLLLVLWQHCLVFFI